MRNLEHSKLIYFLASFTSEELKEFQKYLESPLFNRKEEPVRFFEYIKKYCLKSKIKDIEEKKATSFIWPGEKVPAGRLDKLKNSMLDFCLDYMSFRQWNQAEGLKGVQLIRELNRINDRSYFAQYFRKAEDALEKTDHNVEYYELVRELHNQNLIYMQKSEDRTEEDHFSPALHSAEVNIITLALRWAFLLENRKMITKEEEMASWMKMLLDSLKVEDLQGATLASLYYYLYLTVKHPEKDENFAELKNLVIEKAVRLEPREARDIYTGTINNFLRRRMITGAGTLEEILELYQSMVEVVARGKQWGLNPWHYKNIVYLGSILEEFEWVGRFLEDDLDLIHNSESEREVAVKYNRGVYEFYSGNYAAAQRCFNEVLPDAQDPQYELDSRIYLLMCAFETGDSMGTESQVHSFRMFLSRNKRIPEVQKENYKHFVRLYCNLLATPPKDNVRLQKLKADISQLKFSAGRTWLNKKLEKVPG